MDKTLVKARKFINDRDYINLIVILSKDRKLKYGKLKENEISDPTIPLELKYGEAFNEFRKLIKSDGFDLRKELRNGLLFCASTDADTEQIKVILRGNTDLNTKDLKGKTPLHHATSTGSAELVELLLDNGADPEIKDINSLTPFFTLFNYRAEEYEEQSAKKLAEKRYEVAKLLIKRGADINGVNRSSDSLIYYAIERGTRDILNLFIDNGLEVNARKGFYTSPLIRVVAIGRPEEDLLEFSKILLNKGADVNFVPDNTQKKGYSPLHFAAVNQNDISKVVKLFLDNGAKIDALNENNETALHLAVKSKKRETVKVLIEKGADYKLRDLFGATPLLYARIFNLDDIAQIIPDTGYSICETDKEISSEEESLLHVISQERDCNKEILGEIIKSGYPVNAQQKDGYTPLALASLWGNVNAVKAFLENGADKKIANHRKETPLKLATQRKKNGKQYLEIIELLK